MPYVLKLTYKGQELDIDEYQRRVVEGNYENYIPVWDVSDWGETSEFLGREKIVESVKVDGVIVMDTFGRKLAYEEFPEIECAKIDTLKLSKLEEIL